MEIHKAFSIGNEQGFFEESYRFLCKSIWQLLGFFTPRQAGELIVATWAVAGEHRNFVRLFIFAAVGDVSVVMLVFLFHKATASVVSPPLG